jgi:hypothetical protein
MYRGLPRLGTVDDEFDKVIKLGPEREIVCRLDASSRYSAVEFESLDEMKQEL